MTDPTPAMKHKVRRTNPRSKWPYRIVRFRLNKHGDIIRQHKLLSPKCTTKEAAQAWLDAKTADGTIARLA